MCGILCCFKTSKLSGNHKCPEHVLKKILENRGPNSNSIVTWDNAIFAGYVLTHQGHHFNQPVESNEYILLFNGDIFNLDKYNVPLDISDTEYLFKKLSKSETEDELIKCFHDIEGPFSLVFYNKTSGDLYFARDSLGRNSLLLERNSECLRILSTSWSRNKQDEEEFTTMELPPLGIYKINQQDFSMCTVFPWQTPDEYWQNQANTLESCFEMKFNIEKSIDPLWLLTDDSLKMFSFNFYDIDSASFTSISKLYDDLVQTADIPKALNDFSNLMENSVKKRVQLTTAYCSKCLPQKMHCDHSKIAILFSGGIDCSILAVLADKFVQKSDSIDLINVAFEAYNGQLNNWDVPDRISARCSLDDLQKLCPTRKWNFIEVNVTREMLKEQMTQHIKHLIYPLNTVLDESIGCAFWFASKGRGLLDSEKFESSARVIIVGSGADELFGGYVRHKNAYKRCAGSEEDKQKSLYDELEKDWQRIPSRNLARDDRVISDNGKTPRAPFIEENVVRFARSLRPNQRCCFLYDEGVGDKIFLRLYGHKLALTSSTFLKKRAIQFGSKIANKKQNANDRSAYM